MTTAKQWTDYFDYQQAIEQALKSIPIRDWYTNNGGERRKLASLLNTVNIEHLPSYEEVDRIIKQLSSSYRGEYIYQMLGYYKRVLRNMADQQPNPRGIVKQWHAQIIHAASYYFDRKQKTPYELAEGDSEIVVLDKTALLDIDAEAQFEHDYNWLKYFSPAKALEQVAAHIATLGSTGSTDNTKVIYNRGLSYFFQWTNALDNLAHPFPDTELVQRYIAHLMHSKPNQRGGNGLSARTIASKYMAPLRLYLQKLRLQRIDSGDAMEIIKYKNYLDEALAIKNPKSKKTTHQSALYAHGNRLTKSQVDSILSSFDLRNLRDKRDYALMYTAFTVALRLSELQRLTLADIQRVEDGYVTTVMGKRNNEDPTDFDPFALGLICEYIEAYNEPYEEGDPRRITRDTPIWQPLLKGGKRKGNKATGMTNDGISRIVKRISRDVLGFEISPHDCRRTYGAIARLENVSIDAIQRQYRHASLDTTMTYCGPLIKLSKARLSNVVTFATPARQQPLQDAV